MSFSTITIYRALPVVNGFVQVPDNSDARISTSDAIDAVPEAQVRRFTNGSGSQTGSHFGAQEWLELPGITPDSWYETDPVAELNDI